jgi:hypothetical protein
MKPGLIHENGGKLHLFIWNKVQISSRYVIVDIGSNMAQKLIAMPTFYFPHEILAF